MICVQDVGSNVFNGLYSWLVDVRSYSFSNISDVLMVLPKLSLSTNFRKMFQLMSRFHNKKRLEL